MNPSSSFVYYPENYNIENRDIKQIILRIPVIRSRLGCSSATLYRRIADRLWTRPVKISANIVGWPEYEVNALVAARVAGKTDEQIKDLVQNLEFARKKSLFYYPA